MIPDFFLLLNGLMFIISKIFKGVRIQKNSVEKNVLFNIKNIDLISELRSKNINFT